MLFSPILTAKSLTSFIINLKICVMTIVLIPAFTTTKQPRPVRPVHLIARLVIAIPVARHATMGPIDS